MRQILTPNTLHDKERGFTLIEILLALAITGILAIGIVVAIAQINKVDYICNSRVIAVKQVENAVHYINRDIQQAQKIEVNGSGYWIRLTWVSWEDNSQIQVIYNVDGNQNLIREELVTLGGSTTTSSTNVAKYIESGSKIVTAPDTGQTPPEKSWTVQLTSSYTSGSKTATETREIKVIPRPGS